MFGSNLIEFIVLSPLLAPAHSLLGARLTFLALTSAALLSRAARLSCCSLSNCLRLSSAAWRLKSHCQHSGDIMRTFSFD